MNLRNHLKAKHPKQFLELTVTTRIELLQKKGKKTRMTLQKQQFERK